MAQSSDSSTRSWRDRFSRLQNLPRLVKLVWQAGPWLASCVIISRVLRALVPIVSLFLGKLVVDYIVQVVQGKRAESADLHMLILASLALAVFSDVMGRTGALAESLLSDRFTNKISVDLIRHASKLDLADCETPAFHDKLERARRQTTGRMQLVTTLLSTSQSALILVGLATTLAAYFPMLLVMLILAVIPVFASETRYGALRYSLLYRLTPQRRELDYLRTLGTSQEAAKEVRLFGLGGYLADRYKNTAENYYRENRLLSTRRAAISLGLGVLSTVIYYSAYALIVYRAVRGRLTVGDVTLLSASFAQSRTIIESIVLSISEVFEHALYLDDLFSFLNMKPRIVPPAVPLLPPRPFKTGLELRNVSFRYPGAERDVLHNVNLELRPGQRVALVGSNGAGKTTLAKLIARLYDPTEGQILLDGVDLRQYDLDLWWRELGIIFQDFVHYNMRVSENIGLGHIDYLNDRSRIENAALLSGASAVAARLENGLDHMIGPMFDRGSNLSLGEWQKIALARAYIRNAQLLILDEPTASLDAEAERDVFEMFSRLTRNKTAVLISHRFSTVRMADQILVVEDGHVIEQGAHEDLLATRGRYAELFEMQAAGYR